MKTWKTAGAALLAAALAWTAAAGAETGPAAGAPEPPAAVLDAGYLVDLAQELYWWYLDEEVLEMRKGGSFRFDVRRLTPAMDEGDRSEWAEVRVPGIKLGVVLKRPDYRIEETGAEIRGRQFRMVEVFRIEGGRAPTDGLPGGPWTRREFGTGEMIQHLWERNAELRFPGDELSERLRRACRRQMELDPDGHETGDQVMHIAPLSDVSNMVWVYIENQRLLVQFSTDRELEDLGSWTWEDLRVRWWDLFDDTVSVLGEMPGSNLFMTMDQAGRALYNCVVLGKRVIVVNSEDPGVASQYWEHDPERPPEPGEDGKRSW